MALIALAELSGERSGHRSVSEIAQKRGLSKNTLSKVLQTLAAQGYIESIQGNRGGYALLNKAREAHFFQLLVDFGEYQSLSCSTGCEINPLCNIKSPLTFWEQKFENFLKGTPLTEFFETSFEQLEVGT